MTSRAWRSTAAPWSSAQNRKPNWIIGPTSCRRELELGDDAEVAAAAPDRPEQVGVLRRRRRARTSPSAVTTRADDQVVDRQPAHAGSASPSRPQGQAAHAGVADQPGRDREAVGLGGGVEVAEQRAAPHDRAPGVRVDPSPRSSG